MNSANTATGLQDVKINIKLAALWVAVMLLYVYNDMYFLYEPKVIENIIAGMVWKLEITQAWALSSMILMAIPILMIVLSVTLKAKVNRWANIIVGVLYIVVEIGNLAGETWAFYILAGIIEAVLTVLIVWYAWKWPQQEA
ncbi:MAG: hypothetical protein GY832_21465 [Chloroflexi bacterium]|nr:hypothetical protein [Chloroflexota bacterium]